MIVLTVLGDPDDLSIFLTNIIDSGNDIKLLRLTKSKATYIVGFESSGPVVNNYILLESGDFMLLESGDRIIL